MNTYKHTPGPWLVSIDGFARKGWAACPTVYACDSDLRYIAFCNDDMTVGEPTDNEANARLISAAPDLLEALESVLANAGPIEPEAVAKRIGDRNYRSTRAHLVALESAGKAERLPGGRYVAAGRMAA